MPTSSDPESFPELDALREELEAKHRRLLVMLSVASALFIAVGAALVYLSQDPERLGYALPGAFLICLGIAGFGRMLLSKYTDHDTRDREEFVGVADGEKKRDGEDGREHP